MHEPGNYLFYLQKNKSDNLIKLGKSKDVFKRINNELKQTLSIKSRLKDGEVFVWKTDDYTKVELLMKKIIKQIAIEDKVKHFSVKDDNSKEIYRMTNEQIEKFFINFKHEIISNKLDVKEIIDFRASDINITKSDKFIPCLINNFNKLKNFSFQKGKNINNAQKNNIQYRLNKITKIPINEIIQINKNKIKFLNIKQDDNTNYTIKDFKWDINHTYISNELINLETNKTIDLLTDNLKLATESEYKSESKSESESESESEFEFESDYNSEIDSDYNPETDSDIDSETDQRNDYNIIKKTSYKPQLNDQQKRTIETIIKEQIKIENENDSQFLDFDDYRGANILTQIKNHFE